MIVDLPGRTRTGSPLPAARAGQYLTVRVTRPARRRLRCAATRCPPTPGAAPYRISVKREGVVSATSTPRSAPAPSSRSRRRAASSSSPRRHHPVLLISAGVGATPVLAMLHELAAAAQRPRVWWIHAARDAAQHAFGRRGPTTCWPPRAHERVFYSRRTPPTASRPTPRSADSAGLPPRPSGRHDYCGPASFMTDIGRPSLEAVGPSTLNCSAAGDHPGSRRRPRRTNRPGPGTGPLSFARSDLDLRTPLILLELADACDVPSRGCLPDRRLPHLHHAPALRRHHLLAGPVGTATRRPDARLLRPARHRGRPRHVTGR